MIAQKVASREYFYEIDQQGRLLHGGTELSDPRFLDFFFRRLRDNDTGRHGAWPFLSPCGLEHNFVRAADRPIVFQRLADGRLGYAANLWIVFEPAELRVSGTGRLYHPAPVGGFGLLASALALRLGEDVREQQPGYVLRWSGQDYPIRSLPGPERPGA